MFSFGLDQIMGEHRIVKRSLDFDSVVFEDEEIVFDILADLQNGCIFKYRAEYFEYFLGLVAVFWTRDVIGFSCDVGKRNPNQISFHGIDRGGFGIKADFLLEKEITCQFLDCFVPFDFMILMGMRMNRVIHGLRCRID